MRARVSGNTALTTARLCTMPELTLDGSSAMPTTRLRAWFPARLSLSTASLLLLSMCFAGQWLAATQHYACTSNGRGGCITALTDT